MLGVRTAGFPHQPHEESRLLQGSPTTLSPIRPSSPCSPQSLEPQRLSAPLGAPLEENVVPPADVILSLPCPSQTEHPRLESDGEGCEPAKKSSIRHTVMLRGTGEETDKKLETVVALISLLEQHAASLDSASGLNTGDGAAGLLNSLLVEREKMVAEIQNLKETLKTERTEWLQFQSDLQVAVSVAERMRLEAEEALSCLRVAHRDLEERLALSTTQQIRLEGELNSIRAELASARNDFTALTLKFQHSPAELETSREDGESLQQIQPSKYKAKGSEMMEGKCETSDGAERLVRLAENLELRHGEEPEDDVLKIRDPPSIGEKKDILSGGYEEEGERKMESRGYVRETGRIVMLTERSRSFSQLPLPSPSSSNLANANTIPKGQETVIGRRAPWLLQRRDSWSSGPRDRQENDMNSESPSVSSIRTGSQDSMNVPIWRHRGSRRNSLLRWCQSRTQGYKNIEITNFSSSWEDGLAFCALYHTYLPTHICYSSLSPHCKVKNLELAFHTGETVGIKATLTVEEMLKEEGPDWQRVLAYVENMFLHFET